MTKQKRALPFIGVRTTTPAPDASLKTGNYDMIYWPWLAEIRRTIANFFTEKTNRSRQCPDDQGKIPLSVNEQLELRDRMQRMGPGAGNLRYGSYPQEPVRFRHIADHLVRGPREEVNDAGVRDLAADDQNDDP